MALGFDAPSNIPFTANNDSTTTVVPYTGYAILGGAANDILGHFYIPFKCEVRMFGFFVNETMVCETQGPVFYFDEEACGAAAVTENGDMGIMTIATGQAAGTMVYNKPIDLATPGKITLEAGKRVIVSLQTDATSGSTVAGMVVPFLVVDYVPETPANSSAMTELEA